MSPRNIPIFIPHLGCPNQCVFCNQRSISGCSQFDEADVERQIRRVRATIPKGDTVEIAFFGGSFTGIERGLMIRLLEVAEAFVRRGQAESIRLSTRPDYIDGEILSILSRYSVGCIELGLQSMDDRVLDGCRRGCTAEQARKACRLLTDAGIPWVGQMMIGLPGACAESERRTAREICRMGASAARIYPTVVFYGTPLQEMLARGEYRPLSTHEAVLRSAAVLRILLDGGVRVLRIGLCSTEQLTDPAAVAAGPNHPALGELVWNEYYYGGLREALEASRLGGREILLRLPARQLSKFVGQHRCNLVRLERETDTRVKKIVGDKNLDRPELLLWQGDGRT